MPNDERIPVGRFRLRADSEHDARELGVRLRRVLLDELPGIVATAVRIENASHEYQAVPGVYEDALAIARNVRRIRARMAGTEPGHYVGRLTSTNPEVEAGELLIEGGEVANPDLVIAHLSPGARLSMEVIFERGVGFQARNDAPEGFIPLDADFGPVLRVAVQPLADALEIEIETDGSIAPDAALSEALRMMGAAVAYEVLPESELGRATLLRSHSPHVSGTSSRNTNPPVPLGNASRATAESYRDFLENGIPRLLDMLFPLTGRPLEPEIEAEAPGRTFTRGRRLELVSHRLEMPDTTLAQCKDEGKTYEARFILKVRALRSEEDGIFGYSHPRAIEEQEIDMGPLPLMSEHGELIVNGGTRTCVMLIDSEFRVRRVGDLLMRELDSLIQRMKPILEDRVNSSGWLTADILKLLPLTALVNDLLPHANWCQWMDETNPLAVVTHRMRTAAEVMGGGDLDEGGRELTTAHFGRLGYLETPEGPNIGLIHTLCPDARIGPEGDILTPYRKVENGRASEEIVWLSAAEEADCRIADAGSVGPDDVLRDDFIVVREGDDIRRVPAGEVQLVPVSPAQPLSYSSALIPFLGHDDPNRALMASNMLRQAVPLLGAEQPLVQSGYEGIAARDTGRMVAARRAGTVVEADGSHIVVLCGGQRDVYDLARFRRSNQASLIDQTPIVTPGQEVVEGQPLADAAGTCGGEIALGRNVLVAYMPFRGLNFEDAICISDELLRDEAFTSISLEEAETEVGDSEVWTAPIGARLNPGDVLVQETSGQRRTLLTLQAPNPVVIVKIRRTAGRVKFVYAEKRRASVGDKFSGRHGNKGVIARVLPRSQMPHLEDGTPVQVVLNTVGVISRMNVGQVLETHYGLLARALATQFVIPPFSTPPMHELREKLKEAGLPETGMFTLYDGATGQAFESPVTVGWLHMTKLAHMVDDKMHASATGAPSMLTRQPSVSRSYNRVGFLEMWALDAYGAGATLQEFMTIKSDDAQGREKAALALLAGEDVDPTGEGASLGLLENALRGLGISVEEER